MLIPPHIPLVTALDHTRGRVQCLEQAIKDIQGACMLAGALDDAEVDAVMLDRIRAIVEEVLGAWHVTAANERENV